MVRKELPATATRSTGPFQVNSDASPKLHDGPDKRSGIVLAIVVFLPFVCWFRACFTRITSSIPIFHEEKPLCSLFVAIIYSMF